MRATVVLVTVSMAVILHLGLARIGARGEGARQLGPADPAVEDIAAGDELATDMTSSRRPQLAEQLHGSVPPKEGRRRIELRPTWPRTVAVMGTQLLDAIHLHDGATTRLVAQDGGSWFLDMADVPSGARLNLATPGFRVSNRDWVVPPFADLYELQIEAVSTLLVRVEVDRPSTSATVGVVRVDDELHLDWGDVLIRGRRRPAPSSGTECAFEGLDPGRYEIMLVEGDGSSLDANSIASAFVDLVPGSLTIGILSDSTRDEVRLTGTVSRSGSPVPGATVLVDARQFTSRDSHTMATVDRDGKFFLSLPTLGSYELVIDCGSSEQRRVVHIADSYSVIDVVLDSGAIHGRVAAMSPSQQLRLSRASTIGTSIDAPQWLSAEVDANGFFSFEPLPFGRYTLSLHGERERVEDVQELLLSPLSPSAHVTLASRTSESIGVRFLRPGGNPLAGKTVYSCPVLGALDHWTVAGTTASDGLLDIALPTPDGALLYVQAPSDVGDGPWQTSGVVRIGPESLVGRAETVVQLAASGRLEVRVVDGVTCVPSRIAVLNEDGVRLPSTGPAYEMRMVHSLHCVPAGRHTLLCNDVAGGRYTRVVEIEAGGTTVVTIDHQ